MSEKLSLSSVIAGFNRKLASLQYDLENSTSEEDKKNYEALVEELTELKEKLGQDQQKLAQIYQKEMDQFLKKSDAADKAAQSIQSSGRKRGESCSEDSNQPKTKRTKTASEDNEKKIPTSFVELPPHLRLAIVKKCSFLDYTQLIKSSRSAYELCRNVKRVTLRVNQVELETDRWQLIRQGILRNLVATTENLRNIVLVTEKLTVNSPLTEDICLFLMSQANVKELEVKDGFECSQELLQDLIQVRTLVQTLRLETIQLNLNGASLDLNLDVSEVETVRIINVKILSTQSVFNLNPTKFLVFMHFVASNEVMHDIIESKSQRSGCVMSFWSPNLSRSRLYDILAKFGNRAKIAQTEDNC